MNRAILTVTALAVALLAAGSATAVDTFEDFTTDPGWEGVGNLPADGLGSDFGYSGGTNNAGGAVGEGGGTIIRSGTAPPGDGSQPPVAYYAANLGGQLTFDDAFSASGKASLTNNGNIFLGFFDSANACFSSLCNGGGGRMQTTAMGWLIDYAGTFMVVGTPPGGWQDSIGTGSTPSGQFDWSITYDPSAGPNGELSGTFAGLSAGSFDIGSRRTGGAIFDRFGIAAGTDAVNACCSGVGPLYIDDVTYTVIPEPAVFSMLACGGLLLLRRRR